MPDISKAYEPQAVENKWYRFWLDEKLFVADAASKKPAYSIVIPPPNVTGVLHMGHVLNNTIQDVLARKARMDGKEVLWLPGTDHAGIATEGMVAKQLRQEEKKSKQEIGREEFIKRVWAWKEKHGGIIISQLKKLGCSCDWTRERFTMDPDYVRNVQRVFVDLYKKGLIYRGKRMVNWCPATQTALSDEEVIMKEQKGFLYYFKVEVAEQPGTFLMIATTRPETIPGDAGIAVNPKDPRYTKFIGMHAIRPLPHELPREQKLIPIVGDESVDFEFGTGVLKVTPAHDKTDFDIGQRHKLAQIEVIAANGTMTDAAGADLKGMDRFKARKIAVEKLKELGALDKEEPYTNKVGFSERADVPIEPRLSEQWFLKYPAVEQSKACVEQPDEKGRAPASGAGVSALAGVANADDVADEASATAPGAGAVPGKMRFHPQRWAKVYDHWLANIQDWCISRQLWWGHRIPVWSRTMSFATWEDLLSSDKNGSKVFFDSDDKSAKVIVFIRLPDGNSYPITGYHHGLDNLASIYGEVDKNQKVTWDICPAQTLSETNFGFDFEKWLNTNGFTQDPDVLDTWFSSWLWPFATMGWPDQTPTLQKFYPTTDLVTGPDIIFFWVARMIMAGYEYMEDLPFRNVYFTGIIRDKQGRKMSKTLGNSPDPLELIGKYGADALRFGTMRGAPLGQDVLFDEKDVELGRNFCNKLWNACRFRQMQGGETQGEITPTLLTGDDKWILLKLNQAIQELTASLADYKFSEAAQTIYRFFWSEYCDWYVEATKAVLQGTDEARKKNTLAVIDFVLSHTLRMFHPFLPFISEELWHGMGFHEDMPADQGGRSIMFAPWPKPLDDEFRGHYGLDDCYLEFADAKYSLVTQGRNLRREANIQAGKKAKYVFQPSNQVTPHDIAVIKILLNAEPLEIAPNYSAPKGTPTVHSEMGSLFLPLEGVIDVGAEKTRLTKELEKINGEIAKVEQKLANENFVKNAPPQVLQEHQKRLVDWQVKKQHVETSLKALEG